MKEIIKKICKRFGIYQLYSKLTSWRDNATCERFECCLGDILLQRDVPNNHQLLLTSRLLDVEEYLENGNETFPYQNAISYKEYGKDHKEETGNKSFRTLVESYKMVGYRSDSFVTLDRDMILLDGNHRMGLQIYEKLEKVSARMLKRKVNFEYSGDWYYRVGLPTAFMERIYNRYFEVQKWLKEKGMTFCVLSDAKGTDRDALVSDAKHLATVLNVYPFEFRVDYNQNSLLGGVLIQFSCMQPDYLVNKGRLISKRTQKIENILKSRQSNYTVIVSKNCMEGMEMYHAVKENVKDEKNTD